MLYSVHHRVMKHAESLANAEKKREGKYLNILRNVPAYISLELIFLINKPY